MTPTTTLWCIKSERDNALYLSGMRFEMWTEDPTRAFVFPTAEDAEKFSAEWTKVNKPHWPCLVRMFRP